MTLTIQIIFQKKLLLPKFNLPQGQGYLTPTHQVTFGNNRR